MLSWAKEAAPKPLGSLVEPLRLAKRRVKRSLKYWRQRTANERVFDALIPLRHLPLSYQSVLRNDAVAEPEVLDCLESGDVIVIPGLIEKLRLQERFDELCRQHLDLPSSELEDVHLKRSVEQVVDGSLSLKLNHDTLVFQSSIMQRLLQPHTESYYLELQPNFRLQLPYAKVKSRQDYIEDRMGRGKLNPHGPHKDSWRYHPENTINVWVSMTHSTPENGLFVLPRSMDYHPRYADKEIAQGVKTYPSQQYVTDLRPGDALAFRAELVHGSILNRSNKTRACLSMRCTATKPVFHRHRVYNYIGVEQGRFDNLTREKLFATKVFAPLCRDTEFGPCEERGTGLQLNEVQDQRIRVQTPSGEKSFPRFCPHRGADLTLGELDEHDRLVCPWHRLCFRSTDRPSFD